MKVTTHSFDLRYINAEYLKSFVLYKIMKLPPSSAHQVDLGIQLRSKTLDAAEVCSKETVVDIAHGCELLDHILHDDKFLLVNVIVTPYFGRGSSAEDAASWLMHDCPACGIPLHPDVIRRCKRCAQVYCMCCIHEGSGNCYMCQCACIEESVSEPSGSYNIVETTAVPDSFDQCLTSFKAWENNYKSRVEPMPGCDHRMPRPGESRITLTDHLDMPASHRAPPPCALPTCRLIPKLGVVSADTAAAVSCERRMVATDHFDVPALISARSTCAASTTNDTLRESPWHVATASNAASAVITKEEWDQIWHGFCIEIV